MLNKKKSRVIWTSNVGPTYEGEKYLIFFYLYFSFQFYFISLLFIANFLIFLYKFIILDNLFFKIRIKSLK